MHIAQDTTDQLVHELGLEAQNMETLLRQEFHTYHNTASLQGKSWFAIGLESNDADQEADQGNKKSVVRRMIDKIVAFIRAVIAKIKAFFGKKDKKSVKEDEDFMRKYKGPNDEAMFSAVDEFMRNMKKDMESESDLMARMRKDAEEAARNRAESARKHQETMDRIKKTGEAIRKTGEAIDKSAEVLRTAKANSSKLDEAISKLEEIVGHKVDTATVEMIVEETTVEKITNSLSNFRFSVLLAMLTPTYHTLFAEILHNVDDVTHGGAQISELDKDLEKLKHVQELLKGCYNEHNEAAALSMKESADILGDLVAGDEGVAARTTLYFTQMHSTVASSSMYMDSLSKVIEQLYDKYDQEAVKQLDVAQKISQILTEFMKQAGIMVTISDKVSDILRNNS